MATLEPISEGVQIGVDLGQRVDPTALCVCEVERRDYELDGRQWPHRPQGGEHHYVVRHLERLPLGTPYPAVVDRLAEVYGKLTEESPDVRLWVDATGVGQPVIDLLEKADLPVVPVYLTGTDKAVKEGREFRLGKAVMVSRLQVLLQSGHIHLPKTAEAEALVQELLSYEIRVTDDAHAQFGAFKVGAHDDLATALGLACWQEPKPARKVRAWGPR